MRILVIIILGAIVGGCSTNKATEVLTSPNGFDELKVGYAEGFRISKIGTSKLVEVLYPFQGATTGYKYLLVPKDQPIPQHEATTRVIRTPIDQIVCTSTTHIPLLDYIGETDRLIGFPTTDYISSEKMRERIDDGKVQELGIDKGLNIELLATLKPDLLMGYTMSSDYGQFKKIEELGIPVVINAEYLEKHPLGRAEWIKFMALFFEKEAEADSVFRDIERNYIETAKLALVATTRPKVMSGIVYGDTWYLPGGQNYASRILKDAGAEYLWAADSSHGFLELTFESVYEKANNAELWIGVGTYKSLNEIKAADERYTKFRSYQSKQVFTYDGRRGAKGGSEFLELGYLRPDIILKDLVKITHPEMLPDYELYFHKKLD
jgi:iron complex transport system substrate-binding protein